MKELNKTIQDLKRKVETIKNKQAEKEIRETTPFSIVTNNIKYLGVSLRK